MALAPSFLSNSRGPFPSWNHPPLSLLLSPFEATSHDCSFSKALNASVPPSRIPSRPFPFDGGPFFSRHSSLLSRKSLFLRCCCRSPSFWAKSVSRAFPGSPHQTTPPHLHSLPQFNLFHVRPTTHIGFFSGLPNFAHVVRS